MQCSAAECMQCSITSLTGGSYIYSHIISLAKHVRCPSDMVRIRSSISLPLFVNPTCTCNPAVLTLNTGQIHPQIMALLQHNITTTICGKTFCLVSVSSSKHCYKRKLPSVQYIYHCKLRYICSDTSAS